MKNLNIYNGTSHSINYYKTDTMNFVRGRYRDETILTNTFVQPSLVIPQAMALNENSSETASMDIYGLCLNLPRFEGRIDDVPDFYRFDVIIVSHRYAEAVIRRRQQMLPDYADRLFTIDQKVKDGDGNLLGCCSFRKVFGIQSLDYYINAFATKQNPSLAAARQCYEYFSNQMGLYPDLRDKTYHLGNLIYSEEMRRTTPRHTQQQIVFNV